MRPANLIMLTYTGLALFQKGLSFILLPFVTRSMPVSEYGMVSVVVAVGGLVGILLGGFLEQAVYRWSVERHAAVDDGAILRISFIWLVLVVPVLGVAVATIFWISPFFLLGVESRTWAVEIAAIGLIVPVSYYVMPSLRATERLRAYVLVAGTSILVLLAGKIVFVILLNGGLVGWTVSDLIAAALTYSVALTVTQTNKSQWSRTDALRLLQFGLPLIPHLIAFWALASLSRPLIALFLPYSAVGTFSAAFNIVNVGLLVLAEVNRALLIEYARETFPAPSRRLLKAMKIQFSLTFVMASSIAAFAPLAGSLLFPPSFDGVVPLIALMSLTCVGFGCYMIAENLIVQTSGVTSKSWVGSVAGTICVLLLTTLLAPVQGAVGVAVATTAGYLCMAVAAVAIVRWMGLDMNWRPVLQPSLITALMILSTLATVATSFTDAAGESQLLLGSALFALTVVIALVYLRRPSRPLYRTG